MQIKNMISVIEDTYPGSYALDWDNVGLLIGRDDKEISKVYIALDATDQVIAQAVSAEADMIITHHPLIFSALKQVNNKDFIGRRILKLIQNDISCYAMHTNYDVLEMSERSAQLLRLEECSILRVTKEADGGNREQGIGRIGSINKKQQLKNYCEYVKECFALECVKVFGEMESLVERVAIAPGSGAGMVEDAIQSGANVLITGDIDHHTGIDAVARGLNIIDAGHYGIEHIFIDNIAAYITKTFPHIMIQTAPLKHPFLTI